MMLWVIARPSPVPPRSRPDVTNGSNIFGKISGGLATLVERAVSKYGLPNGYIIGQEGSGAFIGGLRYGDGTLFTRGDEVLASWRFCTRLLEGWAAADARRGTPLPTYEAGSWGPKEAEDLLARDGRAWRKP